MNNNENDQKREALPRLARKSFMGFICYMDPKYRPSNVHHYLSHKLEQVESGEIKRLIITMPPRHGKSRQAGVDFPLWFMGKDPTRNVISSSYGESLSLKHSRESRDKCRDPKYSLTFPEVELDYKNQSTNSWGFKNGGTFSATTVGGGMTGLGADLLTIDDPHKNREEAESKLVRNKIWEWFTSTAYTRLSKEGRILIIMTRWHVDDLVGRILSPEYQEELAKTGGDEKWHVVELPAICENPEEDELGRKEGEALWEEEFTAKKIAAISASIGSYDYSALYRCNPRLKGGNMANTDNLRFCEPDEVPKDLYEVRGWDLALTTKQKSDFTVGARGGYYPKTDTFYIVNIKKVKRRWFGVKDLIINLAKAEELKIGMECIAGFITAWEEVKKALRGITTVRYNVPKENKMIRANTWTAKIEVGKVVLVKGSWNNDFIDELSIFPDGAHDDQVDAVTQVWEMTYKKRPVLLA